MFVETESGRRTDEQTDRQTRQTDRPTDGIDRHLEAGFVEYVYTATAQRGELGTHTLANPHNKNASTKRYQNPAALRTFSPSTQEERFTPWQ